MMEREIEMFWEREPMFYVYSSDELFRTRLQCRTVSSWCYPKALSASECSLRATRSLKVFFQNVDKPMYILHTFMEMLAE